MWKNVVRALHGYALWETVKIKYRIKYPKAVLALAGENARLDRAALAYLDFYVKRKFAKEAVVLVKDRKTAKRVKRRIGGKCASFSIRICICGPARMEKLYDAYCFYKFYDNIVFTYDSRPEDNRLGMLLEERLVGVGEAVCLGLFGLHQAPEGKG